MVPSTMQTVTLCIISAASHCCAARKNPTQILPAVCGRFHMWSSSKKQVTMLRSSQISSLRTLAAQTLLSCLTGARLSLVLLSPLSTNPPPARTRGGWLHWLFVDCYGAHLSRVLLRSHPALSTFTMSLPKRETPRLFYSKPHVRTCCSTMSTSSGVTSTCALSLMLHMSSQTRGLRRLAVRSCGA